MQCNYSKSDKNYENVDSDDGPLAIGWRLYKVSFCSSLSVVFVFNGAQSYFYCFDTMITVYLTPAMNFII